MKAGKDAEHAVVLPVLWNSNWLLHDVGKLHSYAFNVVALYTCDLSGD
jgi:hypothetical protein